MGAMDVVAKANKTYGKGTATKGVTVYQTPRTPSGIFEFDLGTAGGFPQGKMTEVFGPESSGKTNLVLSTVVESQRVYPDKYHVIIDAEGGLEGKWLKKLGVNEDKLIVVRPDYAEAVVDLVVQFLEAEDVALVAVDSIAALVATAELEKSAESHTMGGNSIVVQKLVRKTTSALNSINKAVENGERSMAPVLIFVNQIRHQIGVMFGSPEKTPGGFAPKFQAALRVRCYGRNIVDKKISAVMPIAKQTDIVIQKWKVPILNTAIKYDMVMIPHKGLSVRQTDCWNTVEKLLSSMGHFKKNPGKGGGWLLFEEPYPTIVAARDKFYGDDAFRADVLKFLIQEGLQDEDAFAGGELEMDDDGTLADGTEVSADLIMGGSSDGESVS